MATVISKYEQILCRVFEQNYRPNTAHIGWNRDELNDAADELGLSRVKNLGDIPYAYRFRRDMPKRTNDTAPDGKEWIIRGAGIGKYRFDLIPTQIPIAPNPSLTVTKIPDATPEIIEATALGDEQALLAKVRYNRLIDLFLGVAAYSLQNHLRTTTKEIGQVEIDELYVAIDRYGRQSILPVQAKGGKDRLGITQVEQDMAAAAEKWPEMECRNISVQFAPGGQIALFELTVQDDRVVIVKESHYKLVQSHEISKADRMLYARMANADFE